MQLLSTLMIMLGTTHALRVPATPPPSHNALASSARLTAAIQRGAARRAVSQQPSPPAPVMGSARFDCWEDYAYNMYGDDEDSTPFYEVVDDDLGLHR